MLESAGQGRRCEFCSFRSDRTALHDKFKRGAAFCPDDECAGSFNPSLKQVLRSSSSCNRDCCLKGDSGAAPLVCVSKSLTLPPPAPAGFAACRRARSRPGRGSGPTPRVPDAIHAAGPAQVTPPLPASATLAHLLTPCNGLAVRNRPDGASRRSPEPHKARTGSAHPTLGRQQLTLRRQHRHAATALPHSTACSRSQSHSERRPLAPHSTPRLQVPSEM